MKKQNFIGGESGEGKSLAVLRIIDNVRKNNKELVDQFKLYNKLLNIKYYFYLTITIISILICLFILCVMYSVAVGVFYD
jgi:ABC-type dipeptide/oligopeptide/nickel transport system ATPase component